MLQQTSLHQALIEKKITSFVEIHVQSFDAPLLCFTGSSTKTKRQALDISGVIVAAAAVTHYTTLQRIASFKSLSVRQRQSVRQN